MLKWWDRLRRGPELRRLWEDLDGYQAAAQLAAQAAKAEADGQAEALRAEIAARDESLATMSERLRLLSGFVRTVKARCHSCGDLTFHWGSTLVNQPDGRPALVAVCETCQRAQKRATESQAHAASQATTEKPQPLSHA